MLLRSCDARYGRALASFGPAPITTHNAFAPIAGTSDSYDVPISELVTNRRKPRNKTRQIATANKKFCATDCGCRDHRPQEDWPALEVQYPYDILLRGTEWCPPASADLPGMFMTSIVGSGLSSFLPMLRDTDSHYHPALPMLRVTEADFRLPRVILCSTSTRPGSLMHHGTLRPSSPTSKISRRPRSTRKSTTRITPNHGQKSSRAEGEGDGVQLQV